MHELSALSHCVDRRLRRAALLDAGTVARVDRRVLARPPVNLIRHPFDADIAWPADAMGAAPVGSHC